MRKQGSINYNLVPFRNMSYQIRRITQWWALKNLLGNIIPFVPFAYYIQKIQFGNKGLVYRFSFNTVNRGFPIKK